MPSLNLGVVAIMPPSGGGQPVLGFITITAGVASLTSTLPLPVNFNQDFCFLRTWPGDRTHIYACGVLLGTGTAVIYRSADNGVTWSLLVSETGTNNFSFIVELIFEGATEHAVAMIGTWNAKAESFHQSLGADPQAGIYDSTAGSAFVRRGSGVQNAYNGANINHPNTGIALAVEPSSPPNYYALHAQTPAPPSLFQAVIDKGDSTLATWNAAPMSFVTGFQYWCLGAIEFHTDVMPHTVFFLGDISGTGAYAFPNSSQIYNWDPLANLYSAVGGPIPSGSVGGCFFDGSGNGLLVGTDTNPAVYQITGLGTGIALRAGPFVGQVGNWRSFAIHPTFPYGLAGLHGVAGANGNLIWTDDGGATFGVFVPPGYGISSLDFGLGVAPPPGAGVFPEVLTWRDARGMTGRAVFYVSASSASLAYVQAQNITSSLNALSNGHLNSAKGAYTQPPVLPLYGSNVDYAPIEERLVMSFLDSHGNTINLEVPAPTSLAFDATQENVDTTNAGIIGLVADCLANGLCSRGGGLAVTFVGGRRRQSPMVRTVTVRTLNPAETGPGE
jgi:hypothetical protein